MIGMMTMIECDGVQLLLMDRLILLMKDCGVHMKEIKRCGVYRPCTKFGRCMLERVYPTMLLKIPNMKR